MFVFACLAPHAPILLPSVGSADDRKKVKKTTAALESLAPKLAASKPDLIIISSPHTDWGFNVPLFFLNPQLPASPAGGLNYSITNYLTTLTSPKHHFEWGKKIIAEIPHNKRVCWIASGDMSHRLKEDGPYGFHPSGPKFDKQFIELLKNKDIDGILNLNSQLVEEAGECGLRSFCMALGALEQTKTNWNPEILSYEGPFGVGYLVANLKIK